MKVIFERDDFLVQADEAGRVCFFLLGHSCKLNPQDVAELTRALQNRLVNTQVDAHLRRVAFGAEGWGISG